MTSININPTKAVKLWYIPLVSGLLFLIVGFMIFLNPESSLETLIAIFSLGFILLGISEVIFSLINRYHLKSWISHLIFGLVTTMAGFLCFMNPEIVLETISYFVAFVILFRSIFKIVFALNIKKYGSANWPFMLLLGILGILLSFLLLYNTIFAITGIAFLLALSFLLTGLFSIYFSLQLRMLHKLSNDRSFDLTTKVKELADELRKDWD